MIAADEFRGFGSMATRLIENGYLPVPLVKGQKKPFLSDWVKYRFMAGDEQRFADRGTGIICGAQVGVDVDVRDPTIAAQIRTVFEDLLGLAPRESAMRQRCCCSTAFKARASRR